jgi:multidrug resistance efflux pump
LKFAADTSTLEWELANLTLQFAERSADRNIEVVRANRDAATALLNQLNDKTAIEVLDAEIKVATQKSEASELKAPAAGTILKTYVSAGQTVTQMPILRMADLDHMVCIAEVYDSAAKSIAPDQKVKIRSPAFKAPYDKEGIDGKVSRVGKMVASPGLSNPNPLAQSAKRVVEVAITITTKDVESLQLVDLQVNVEFIPPKKP